MFTIKNAKENIIKNNKSSHFFALLCLVLGVKIGLAMVFPITIDEAYYYQWGKYPHLQYYDHPPMVGWLMAALLQVSSAVWWLRMPAVLASVLLAYVWYRVLLIPEEGQNGEWASRVRLACSIFLISPASILYIVITTDAPAILFSGLSLAALLMALRQDKYRYAVLAGCLMGLAIWSKFLVFGLFPALFVFFVLFGRSYWRHVLIFGVIILIFTLGLLLLNANSCWTNIMFMINRDNSDEIWYKTLLNYVFIVLYLGFPLYLFVFRKKYWKITGDKITCYWGACLVGVPLVAFAALSLFTSVGLHWILSAQIFWFIFICLIFEVQRLKKIWNVMVVWSTLHLIIIITILLLPLGFWEKHFPKLIFDVRTQDVFQAVVEKMKGDRLLFTEGYKAASFFSYFSGELVPNFWSGSRHGRNDDVQVDFRQYNGKNFIIFEDNKQKLYSYQPFFNQVNMSKISVHGQNFWLIEGNGFKFDVHRDRVLAQIREQYYQIPRWLPTLGCPFVKRYWGGE
jgi:hypothetical protein